ncbi:MAG TPA: class I SAM-dependent methyltransferase [Nocardioidaceae bacterium]|jgi:SAM-dependent methyltransferase|nr:class I SAM-dependent methyltransferase [Nocardioidaceae bacterium]
MTGSDREERTRRMAVESLAADDPTGWFEHLYLSARTGEAVVPWDRGAPHPLLVQWAEGADGTSSIDRRALRAVVVGCGLGSDAEFVAGLGFDTTAFDIAASAIETARGRFPDSPVDYRTADLLDLPPELRQSFDFVFESLTVQSLPIPLRSRATAGVAELVRPGGTLLVVASARDEGDPLDGPPWPLTRAEVEAFAVTEALEPVRIEEIGDTTAATATRWWRAEFRR